MDETPPSGGIDPPDAEVRYVTEYIDIAPLSPSFPLCAGTLAMLDDQVEYVLSELETSFEGRIMLYLFDGSMVSKSTWCHQYVSGCAVGTTIYSSLAVLSHEIVHAVAPGGGGWWEEGVAHGLGDPVTFFDPIGDWKANLVTIPADGSYWFVADHPDASLALQPCPDEPVAEYVEGAYSWPLELRGEFGPAALRAGPHVLQVHLPPGSPATVRVVAYPHIGE